MIINAAGHLRIMRLSHWVKNVFVLPGILVAVAMDRSRLNPELLWRVPVGLLAMGLVASSYYVLNEILDGPTDRNHPTKRTRPVPSGMVNVRLAYVQWLALGAAGIWLGGWLCRPVAVMLAVLWMMGCVYNIPPIRLKDVPYLDVLSEGVNNPLRFLVGWYLTGTQAIPTSSLLVSYWMAGCYFMAVKRLAEYRAIGDSERSAAYRRSFAWYTESRLLELILFCASVAMLFFGAFLMRYRMELVLSFPFVAWVMSTYLQMAFQEDSAAQRPETLHRQPRLVAAVACCAAAMVLLLFIDVPVLYRLFAPTVVP
jgi:4-hydroxybenzoate polyprenyltransferase